MQPQKLCLLLLPKKTVYNYDIAVTSLVFINTMATNSVAKAVIFVASENGL
jgi:hypothetical protein